MKVAAIIPCAEEGIAALPRLLESLTDHCDQIIVVWHGISFALPKVSASVSVTIEHVASGPRWAARAVERGAAVAATTGTDFIFVLFPGEFLSTFLPEHHPCFAAAESSATTYVPSAPETRPPAMVGAPTIEAPRTFAAAADVTPKSVLSTVHCVQWVEDAAATKCLSITHECRGLRLGSPYSWTQRGFAPEGTQDVEPGAWLEPPPVGVMPACYMTQIPILRQPLQAFHLEMGDPHTALRLSCTTKRTRIENRYRIKAMKELDRRKAIEALQTLFDHCSIYEELWRLSVIMDHLPYTIEDSVEVATLRDSLDKQIGHLRVDGRWDEEVWYRDGSPGEIIDEAYVAYADFAPPQRLRWLIGDCRARGYKRVVELGSVDGVSLFQLQKLAPEIEWHGVEVNPIAVAHAQKISSVTGIPIRIHRSSFGHFHEHVRPQICDDPNCTIGCLPPFDAAVLFEVLEHNAAAEPILDAAEKCVRPGGRIYISTPDGAWGLHEDANRVVTGLRKDHVNAWTVARMRRLLESSGKRNIEVLSIENPEWWFANGNVHATYTVE